MKRLRAAGIGFAFLLALLAPGKSQPAGSVPLKLTIQTNRVTIVITGHIGAPVINPDGSETITVTP